MDDFYTQRSVLACKQHSKNRAVECSAGDGRPMSSGRVERG